MTGLLALPAVGELPVALKVDSPSPRAVVVALHGIQTNADWFEPLGRELARQHLSLRAVNVPERGMPHPPAADAQDWRQDWVAPLKAAARQVNRQTGLPVVLLGTSWGGRPVLRAAFDAGDRADWCRGVVLIAPALKTSADKNFLWRAKLSPSGWFQSRSSTFVLPLRPADYTRSASLIDQWLTDADGREGARLVRTATLRHFSQTTALRTEVKQTLPQLKVPVLALFGSADTLVNLDGADTALGKLKLPCETRIIAGGTHAMQLDKAPQLAALISNWLERKLEKRPDPRSTVHLDSRVKSFPCGIDVTEGRRYQFLIERGQIWQDDSLDPCDPIAGDPTLHHKGLGWLRRVKHDALDHTLRPRYFQPIVTINEDDTTGIVVQPGRVWQAPKSGPLRAFANDAGWDSARANNHGFITFRIVPAD